MSKNLYDQLDELIINEAKYFNNKGSAEEIREEDFYRHLQLFLHDAMKEAYILGHAQGALATLDVLPDEIKSKCEFDESLD